MTTRAASRANDGDEPPDGASGEQQQGGAPADTAAESALDLNQPAEGSPPAAGGAPQGRAQGEGASAGERRGNQPSGDQPDARRGGLQDGGQPTFADMGQLIRGMTESNRAIAQSITSSITSALGNEPRADEGRAARTSLSARVTRTYDDGIPRLEGENITPQLMAEWLARFTAWANIRDSVSNWGLEVRSSGRHRL
ncbi:hypothetical protein EMIHUDRAFT_222899 [Emiliania huxleyi CCMP1516]|uniref:Uncharacterized protein n=2 Tax=Emiliania huxleyi TaxID=2903 RepID=A0A0D3KXC6_EMIH1|nr:hypothetical protein EMIHUDRAFT_222899 [Emiliania huxleyi CCMP1516]EOD40411.1 hypothetical protein EMIHUDRAFT_222899 [Emiliania huxleyi CCMP1516]|eukprot:XP_005792840.1 hypothetical protein EMIHUDRAFT_222899 [Emiliania huxleyi CCMP1516]